MAADDDYGFRFTAMASMCEVRIGALGRRRAAALAAQAIAEVRRIETKYSRYRADSVVSRINASAGSGCVVAVDEETARLLDFAAGLWAESDGLFDITSGTLRKAWDFRARRMPAPGELEALLRLVGWSRVRWSGEAIALPLAGMEIDFGGFGKEYAADRAATALQRLGVRSGLVNLGGDIRVIGPRPDRSPWSLGIQDPRDATRLALLPHPRSAHRLAGLALALGERRRAGVPRGRRADDDRDAARRRCARRTGRAAGRVRRRRQRRTSARRAARLG